MVYSEISSSVSSLVGDGASKLRHRWSQLKNLVLPMPPNCDIRETGGEDRLCGIKGRNIFRQMLNSSSIHHTANMKLLLLTSVICFAAALAAPADKQKRDILPGDPRYGTDHHHHHHHHEHENEVQITKAVGGYAGSYSVPDTEIHSESFQAPNPTYGPPSYKPGKLIGGDYLAPVADTLKNSIQVPSTSYGIPDTTQLNNNYLGPAIEEQKASLAEAAHAHTLNTDYQAPSAEAPITSYGLPDVKNEEHIHASQTSYGTPVVKTVIHEEPNHETVHLQKSVAPEVHHEHISEPIVHKHVETTSNIVVPQVKVSSHIPETQGIIQQTGSSSVPSFTSTSSNGVLPSVYTSYPTGYTNGYTNGYRSQSIGSIPVKTIDHHVHVQVPQPYPVPVTKHVTYRVPVPHTVEVPRPYYVRVPQPVRVTVNRPYPVEVPRAVPYPVPHYVHTSVPVVHQQQHHAVETVKANPVQSFFENTASAFQDTISNIPSFTNPLDNFQNPFDNFNPFENFQIPSLPAISLPALPSLPSFAPSQPSTVTAPAAPVVGADNADVSAPSNDAVSIENPIFKTPAVSKTIQHTVTTKKEYVQPTDENGGYIY